MPTAFPAGSLSVRRLLAEMAVGIACLTAVAMAVGKDKAMYIGGTLKDFPSGSAPFISLGTPKVEGRVDTTSESEFKFEAGRWGLLAIPYKAISSLEYGLTPRHRAPRALVLFIPWHPTEQFTRNAHYVLTLAYQDQSGSEQEVVFELGSDLVRPTLETLERRTGRAIDFQNVEACTLYRTAEECGYGRAVELKGLNRTFLDAGIHSEHRELIVAELQKEDVGLQMMANREDAEIVLNFHGERFQNLECPLCEGGRGEVSVVQGNRRRVVLVFAARKTGVGQRKPATNFGRAFVEAFKNANSVR